ncbi:DUF3862 domain-containing protein [Secundilactobacillus muriivasis]
MTNLESAFTSPLDKLAKSVSVPKVKNALDGKRNSAKLVSNELFSTKLYPIGEDITMRKVATVGVTLLAALALTACGNSNSSSNSDKETTSSSKKAEPKNAITLTKYNRIKVGDITSGQGGSAESTVKSMYGKPESKTETTVTGSTTKASQYTWTNVGTSLKGATITAQFVDGKAVGKGYSNADFTDKINSSTYKSLQTGTTLTAVKKQLGTPAGEIITGTGAMSSQVLTYTNGKRTISLTFTGDKLTTKSETSI